MTKEFEPIKEVLVRTTDALDEQRLSLIRHGYVENGIETQAEDGDPEEGTCALASTKILAPRGSTSSVTVPRVIPLATGRITPKVAGVKLPVEKHISLAPFEGARIAELTRFTHGAETYSRLDKDQVEVVFAAILGVLLRETERSRIQPRHLDCTVCSQSSAQLEAELLRPLSTFCQGLLAQNRKG